MKMTSSLLPLVTLLTGFLIVQQAQATTIDVGLYPHYDGDSKNAGQLLTTDGDVNGDGFSDLFFQDHKTIKGIYGSKKFSNKLESDEADITIALNTASDSYVKLSTPGDLNGDSFDELLILNTDSGGQQQLYLFYGSQDGISTSLQGADVIAGTDLAAEYNLQLLTTRGDLNGDGLDDLIFGSPDWNCSNKKTACGAIYIIFGQPAHLKSADFTTPDVAIYGTKADEELGGEFRVDGDINGDGVHDLAFLDYGKDTAKDIEGTQGVGVFYGRTSWEVSYQRSEADVQIDTLLNTNTTGQIQHSLSTHGDVNGDGYDDLLFGVDTDEEQGTAYLFFGGSNLASKLTLNDADVTLTMNEEAIFYTFDARIVRSQDMNLDGIDDVLVFNTEEETLSLFYGRENWPKAIKEAKVDQTWFIDIEGEEGGRISSYTDVDGDGKPDMVVSRGSESAVGTRGKVFFITSKDTDDDGFSGVEGDCDNTTAEIRPDADEGIIDHLDNNCNGDIDEDYEYSVEKNGLISEVVPLSYKKIKAIYADGNYQIIDTIADGRKPKLLLAVSGDHQLIIAVNATGSIVYLLDGYSGEEINEVGARSSGQAKVRIKRFEYLDTDFFLLATTKSNDLQATVFEVTATELIEASSQLFMTLASNHFQLDRFENEFTILYQEENQGSFIVNADGELACASEESECIVYFW
ncbi:MAG: FG-GAP repeat protein [Candidatus Kerfeldbacteria bacterium]|nr:FG-GAP repeat protein [Candidatus Kerfeldbacteria bacterium]